MAYLRYNLKLFRPPTDAIFQKSRILDRIFRALLHLVPAYIIDVIAQLLGHKPFLVRIIGKMHAGLNLVEFFCNREWTWSNKNVVALSKELNATDAAYFNFRVHNIDWEKYWHNYLFVLRTHFFKYKPDTIELCKQRLKKIQLIYNSIRSLLIIAILYLIIAQFTSYTVLSGERLTLEIVGGTTK